MLVEIDVSILSRSWERIGFGSGERVPKVEECHSTCGHEVLMSSEEPHAMPGPFLDIRI
jgi:hypothetical protein